MTTVSGTGAESSLARVRAFACPVCSNPLYFENSRCLNCGSAVGFRWATRDFERARTRCANAGLAACNWLADGGLCESCARTRTIPAEPDERFADAERAKRRLLFELAELGLPIEDDLRFDLLDDAMTGHADGLITLDVAEADDPHRELMRQQMHEPYRTVLGHFRHEIGHYLWPKLVRTDEELATCRTLFGDDRADYGEALQRHYDNGPPDDWHERHVSAYATMHPYEGWAETFAQYLHIADALQTAVAYGLLAAPVEDPLATWVPLSIALNQMNRSLGQGDLYPYVLAPAVVEKLEFVRALAGRRAPSPM
jgi:hypothetical protein